MSIYRDKSDNCWISSCRFKDANGTPKITTKRGFETKEEAGEWERRLKSESSLRTLTISEFFRVYARDIKPTVTASTWEKIDAFCRRCHAMPSVETMKDIHSGP
ncbi:Arm DNA-binding domain-containing protein [Adlercreutzia equolifaciens]|uniref:Arm DNA-binding domain-containing protein n=1 Tax=Adlercreutzia equolifaciens TaxID=446660 RepID=UPI003D18D647